MPRFIKPKAIRGNKLVFRDATVADAAFILGLRTDASKGRYLSATSPDLAKQEAWLAGYAQDAGQIYFIIEDTAGEAVGTVRLYDQQGDSFCWGSWIKKDGAPSGFAIESALIIYHYALHLGFAGAHFDVRKGNTGVIQFHERFGAQVTGESELDYYFKMDQATILATLAKYEKYLPNGIQIED
ncbi:GNAT family N-acetyltransferase [Massilia sp. MB5]|uniref:GNAT family N-acetyltransferase n=1 Tax=unclassified Massilia TaxID=2609279 RepID=UPI00067AE5D1|nr:MULTISPECIES: GNAT family N-acetyltransferase [unclassified Massilia]AKU23463.1 hypothetical protein ACZ75_20390 [Massilia sp. NR 4-1]UMR31615.1 GNAT family N-acetyltransferase [Massilia sp. MB5]